MADKILVKQKSNHHIPEQSFIIELLQQQIAVCLTGVKTILGDEGNYSLGRL